jgi:hypothetical protein
MQVATISTNQILVIGIGGGIVYLVIVFLVAMLGTQLFGDAPMLVVLTAVLWPGLLIPVLVATLGYRVAGGHKLDGRRAIGSMPTYERSRSL